MVCVANFDKATPRKFLVPVFLTSKIHAGGQFIIILLKGSVVTNSYTGKIKLRTYVTSKKLTKQAF